MFQTSSAAKVIIIFHAAKVFILFRHRVSPTFDRGFLFADNMRALLRLTNRLLFAIRFLAKLRVYFQE